MTTYRLFVYGTLAPGRPNHHILQPIAGSWDEGSVKGTLHDAGWGAAMGCPGIVLEDEGDSVDGFVFSSDHLAHHWPMVDEFEGDGYERVVTKVRLKDRREVDAFIYVLNGETKSS